MIEWNKLRKMLKELAVISVGNAQKIYPLIDQMESEGNKLEDRNNWLEFCKCLDVTEPMEALDEIQKILMDACQDFNEGKCSPSCDCDPNGWEGCYTRKILEAIPTVDSKDLRIKSK